MARREEQIGKEAEVFGSEEALAKISMELLDPSDRKLFTVTDVTPEEIFGLSVLNRFADKFDSDVMHDWVEDFCLFRISRLRAGRNEFVVINTGLREFGEMRKKGSDIRNVFSGLK